MRVEESETQRQNEHKDEGWTHGREGEKTERWRVRQNKSRNETT